jgi:hypothetical protein
LFASNIISFILKKHLLQHNLKSMTPQVRAERLASEEPCLAQQPTALCRQAHFLEKFCVSRVVMETFEQRIGLDVGKSSVSLFVSTLQPFKRFVGLPAKRIHLSDLIGRISVILRDEAG